MQCNAMRCNAMQCDVMWCDVMWCDVMWCDVMWCDVMWCDVMWCDGMMGWMWYVLYCTVLYLLYIFCETSFLFAHTISGLLESPLFFTIKSINFLTLGMEYKSLESITNTLASMNSKQHSYLEYIDFAWQPPTSNIDRKSVV